MGDVPLTPAAYPTRPRGRPVQGPEAAGRALAATVALAQGVVVESSEEAAAGALLVAVVRRVSAELERAVRPLLEVEVAAAPAVRPPLEVGVAAAATVVLAVRPLLEVGVAGAATVARAAATVVPAVAAVQLGAPAARRAAARPLPSRAPPVRSATRTPRTDVAQAMSRAIASSFMGFALRPSLRFAAATVGRTATIVSVRWRAFRKTTTAPARPTGE